MESVWIQVSGPATPVIPLGTGEACCLAPIVSQDTELIFHLVVREGEAEPVVLQQVQVAVKAVP